MRRLRELDGWASALEGARLAWPWVPEETWWSIGELDGGAHRFLPSCNVLYSEGCRLGFEMTKPRR